MASGNVVERVVKGNRCTGCGVCAAVCPRAALEMATLPNGDLAPVLVGECSEACGVCLSVCPFADGLHDPREENARWYRPQRTPGSRFHEDIGWHLRCAAGFSRVDGHRRSAASGGLTTWCLEQLLVRGWVDKVSIVRLSDRGSRSLFEFAEARSVDEIRSASGSIYHPVEISPLVRQMLEQPEVRWAVVGVPCLCAALRRCKRLGDSVRFVLGLACGMYQNTMYTEVLLSRSGVRAGDLSSVTYRNKPSEGPASNFGFLPRDRAGCAGRDIPYRGLPYFLGRNAYFRLNGCNYCKDVFAETADACFMDAWLPEYADDPNGTSLVVVRSQAVAEILRDGATSGDLHLEDVSPDQARLAQQGHVRRKRELIGMRLAQAPVDGGNGAPRARRSERADWWLQRHTQERSKAAWRRYGRRWGAALFWLSMGDLVIAQLLLGALSRTFSLGRRILRYARRGLKLNWLVSRRRLP